jgi:hypothetical protein
MDTQAAPPAPPAKLLPSKGMAQPIFPARATGSSRPERGSLRESTVQRNFDLVRDDAYLCARHHTDYRTAGALGSAGI